jgi:hypothetical protein
MAEPFTRPGRIAAVTEPRQNDDWDRIEALTHRVRRWFVVGFPCWLVLLILLHERLTGIPLSVGLVMASVLALTLVAIDDRRRATSRGQLSRLGRLLMLWAIAFVVLAIAVSAVGASGVAIVLIPFVGAMMIAGLAELAREMTRRHP